ncbi:sugar ABC transporter permease [Paenibacillus sp. FSL H8-0548]|uniref:carbohydrate ABC transporter permease n=1 Tax=Paenibacillus sp. FSL H8-0548 TaxID=1920422 RepID=UPI00096F2814|nr:sugar ABC transporter permease [Paenibacillus sp. FSL H8-0548]OMF30756.1 sugar ABC transporter permease [Paenibacillus sp. FSL H8-0548]
MEKYLSRKRYVLVFLLPALLVYIFTVMLPIGWSSVYSFFHWDGISPMRFAGLDNYVKMFTQDDVFWQVFKNNIVFMVVNVLLQVSVGLFIAILLTQIKKGREIFQTLYFAPVVLSTVALVQIFQNVFSVNPVGMLNYALSWINLSFLDSEWLSDPDRSLMITAVAEGYKFAAVYMVIFYSALISISEEVVEAAKMDGAFGWKLYRYIKLPMIKGIIFTCIVLVLNGSLKSFDIPYLLTYGGPGTSSELVATYMYKQAFSSMYYGYGSAIAVFIAIECCLLVVLVMKIFQMKKDD